MKRYASHNLRLADGTCLKLQVIEVEEGRVVRHYPLTEEPEDTFWVSGTIRLDEEMRPNFPMDL